MKSEAIRCPQCGEVLRDDPRNGTASFPCGTWVFYPSLNLITTEGVDCPDYTPKPRPWWRRMWGK
jgi:hypothetical protein